MSRDASDRIRAHFNAASRDWTPVPARHAVRVLFAPVSGQPGFSGQCASVLSAAERLRAGRFRSASDRVLFVQRRAFRRFCAATALRSSRSLKGFCFEEAESSRPCLAGAPGLWFSFSSCRFGMLGAWSPNRAIGVDIEDRSKETDATGLARLFFSPAEARQVAAASGPERQLIFYRLWCLKESALKSIGEGLPYGLDSFSFELGSMPRVTQAPSRFGGADLFSGFETGAGDVGAAVVIRRDNGVR
jgi:4'-phosphopantetheinyl transferase